MSRTGYFESFASNRQTEKSDLDLLVKFSKPIGWEFFTLESFLEQCFEIPIYLVAQNALEERIKESRGLPLISRLDNLFRLIFFTQFNLRIHFF